MLKDSTILPHMFRHNAFTPEWWKCNELPRKTDLKESAHIPEWTHISKLSVTEVRGQCDCGWSSRGDQWESWKQCSSNQAEPWHHDITHHAVGYAKEFQRTETLHTNSIFFVCARTYKTEWHSNDVMTSHMFHCEAKLQKCICSQKSPAHQNACISTKQLNRKKTSFFVVK